MRLGDNFEKILERDDVITFGKHKGETLEDILSEEPSYIVWLSEETDNIIDEDLLSEAENLTEQRLEDLSYYR